MVMVPDAPVLVDQEIVPLVWLVETVKSPVAGYVVNPGKEMTRDVPGAGPVLEVVGVVGVVGLA